MGLASLYGGWEEEAQALMKKHVPSGSVVYDLGANYGIHALFLARLVGEFGHVYGFEPVPHICSELQANVALNGFRNVTCVKAAVSDRAGSSSFFTGPHLGAGHLASAGDRQGEEVTVETVTLDDFVINRKNRPPDFIKIDIEGAEGKALAGSEKVLKKCRPIVLVDLHNPEQDLAVGRVLSNCGYEAYRSENGKKVKDLFRSWPDPDGLWGQIIAFPKTSGSST
jgi:FkbM family methyltransferase